jgi:hypothetical protein
LFLLIFATDEIKPIKELGIANLGHNSTQIPQPTQFLRSSLIPFVEFGIDSFYNLVYVI